MDGAARLRRHRTAPAFAGMTSDPAGSALRRRPYFRKLSNKATGDVTSSPLTCSETRKSVSPRAFRATPFHRLRYFRAVPVASHGSPRLKRADSMPDTAPADAGFERLRSELP